MNLKTAGSLILVGSVFFLTIVVPRVCAWDTLFDDTNSTGMQPQEEEQPKKEAGPSHSFQNGTPGGSFLDRARAKGLVKNKPAATPAPAPVKASEKIVNLQLCGTPSLQMQSVSYPDGKKKDSSRPDLLFVLNGNIWSMNNDGSNKTNLTRFANDTVYQKKLDIALKVEGLTKDELSFSPMNSPVFLNFIFHPKEKKIYFSLDYHSGKRSEFYSMDLASSSPKELATFNDPKQLLKGINNSNMDSFKSDNRLLQFLNQYPWLAGITPGADSLLPSSGQYGLHSSPQLTSDNSFMFTAEGEKEGLSALMQKKSESKRTAATNSSVPKPGTRKQELERIGVAGGTSS